MIGHELVIFYLNYILKKKKKIDIDQVIYIFHNIKKKSRDRKILKENASFRFSSAPFDVVVRI